MLPSATANVEGIAVLPDIRMRRTADLHLYVDPAIGNDNNNGQAATNSGGNGPLATFVGLRQTVGKYDGNGYDLYIHLAAATYVSTLIINPELLVGFATIQIYGVSTTQTIFDGGITDISGTGGVNGINVQSAARLIIANIGFKKCISSISLTGVGYCEISDCRFQDCTRALWLDNTYVFGRSNIVLAGNTQSTFVVNSQSALVIIGSLTFENLIGGGLFSVSRDGMVDCTGQASTGSFTGRLSYCYDRSFVTGVQNITYTKTANDVEAFAATSNEAAAGTRIDGYISPATFKNALAGDIMPLTLTQLATYESPANSNKFPALVGKLVVIIGA